MRKKKAKKTKDMWRFVQMMIALVKKKKKIPGEMSEFIAVQFNVSLRWRLAFLKC